MDVNGAPPGYRDDRRSSGDRHASSSHRDRDRDRKHSSSRRDRSRSKDRSRRRRSKSGDGGRDRSASDSPPARPRRQRKSGFDQPPPGGVLGVPATGFSDAPAGFSADPVAAAVLPPAPPPTGFSSGFSAAPPMMGVATGGAGMVSPPSQQATRHARRVYVGGLPPTANEQNIATFFSNALAAVGGTTAGPGPCVVNVYINYEKKFAFVEFRTVEETSNAMALDGIMFEGVTVRVRRPNDYNPAAAAALGPSVPNSALNLQAIGLNSGAGASMLGMTDAAERVFVGGLPYFMSDDQCKELLSSFGALKSFDLVRDRETGNSKGYGFVVFADVGVTDVACAHLNGMRIGERVLTVRRATESRPADAAAYAANASLAAAPPDATRIVKLAEAVTMEELTNDEEYGDILEDMQEECGKHGACIRVLIPRPPAPGQPPPPGLGKVILEFADTTGAVKARNAMHGRKFSGREVLATFLAEDQYAAGAFD
ncbi:hypothetical protein WJX73_009409 [Symbiochloris irregularis]|uniref:Splicing factor U2af large subunit n=1 Tax=Symbiochloris irregularis TaxID=706552 RepID=A0AAW1NPM1_9CHLO